GQQKEINGQIADIRIWSKERSNTHGQTQAPSITSVIIKTGNSSNHQLPAINGPEEIMMNDITAKQRELAGNNEELWQNKETPSSGQFKKEMTVYEPKGDEEKELIDAAVNILNKPELITDNKSAPEPEPLSDFQRNKIMAEITKAEKEVSQLNARLDRIKELLNKK
ncbi:MAG: hypothetical protein AABY22_30010, partial [Nanoarchaeota archaeon]